MYGSVVVIFTGLLMRSGVYGYTLMLPTNHDTTGGYKQTTYECTNHHYRPAYRYSFSVKVSLDRVALNITPLGNVSVAERAADDSWFYLESGPNPLPWYPATVRFVVTYRGTMSGRCYWSGGGRRNFTSSTGTSISSTSLNTSSTFSSFDDVTTVTSHAKTMAAVSSDATCLCPCPRPPHSQDKLDQFMHDLLEDMKITTRSTSKFKRKLMSASDKRWVSRGLGFVGILVLAVAFGSILIGDMKLFMVHIKSAMGRIRC